MAFIEPDVYELYLLFKQLFEARSGHLSTEYHAMMIRQGNSGKPEDVYVNNFTFLADDNKVTAADDISAALVDFYEVSGPTRAIDAYLTSAISNVMLMKIYKLTDPKPREPIVRTHTSTVAAYDGALFPEEAAICLSFSAASPHTNRRRGRVYIGPLNAGCAVREGTTGIVRVRDETQADFAAAAVRLSNHPDAGWLVHSLMAGGTFAAVETGWIDNAFDTQRRRGPKASNRFTWAKP